MKDNLEMPFIDPITSRMLSFSVKCCFSQWRTYSVEIIEFQNQSPNVGLEPTTVGLRVQRSTD